VANNNLECVDCNPPRTFRNLAGLKGHMQFKHDKTGAYVERPLGRQTAMIKQMLDQQQMLLEQQQALYELIAAGFDKPILSNEPIGVFSAGNNNGQGSNNHPGNNGQGSNNNPGNNNGQGNNNNPGNNNQGNNNEDQGDEEQTYKHENCGTPLFPGQERCPSCRGKLDWAAMGR